MMIRVLHVVENFNGQAVESWLTRLVTFEGFEAKRFQFEFFLIGRGQGRLATDLTQSNRLHLGNPGEASIPTMASALRACVRSGAYDVIHIHQDVLSGVFALALRGTSVKLVTHVHNCWQRLPVGGRLRERLLTPLARQLTLHLSDAVVGVSKRALETMVQATSRPNRIDRVIYCSARMPSMALDWTDRIRIAGEVREQQGLPCSAKLLLFLGRLDEYKNPTFALDVLLKMAADGDQDVCLVVAGVGGQERQLRERTADLGLTKRVRVVGFVDDPAPLLLASDLLLMPSQEWCEEGLGLAAVEAQGFGLPVLCSLSIPEDAAIAPGLFRRTSLRGGVHDWAAVARELLAYRRPDLAASREQVGRSAFTNAASYMALSELYSSLTPSPRPRAAGL